MGGPVNIPHGKARVWAISAASPPVGGCGFLGGGGEAVVVEDDADGLGFGGQGIDEEWLHDRRLAAQVLEQRADVAGHVAEAEPVEPEQEVDARLVRRDERRRAPYRPGL